MPEIDLLEYSSPVGILSIRHSDGFISELKFSEEQRHQVSLPRNAFEELIYSELDDYFEGKRSGFSIPLKAAGTDFEQRVWEVVQNIPFGQTMSYSAVASELGDPNSVRAVGRANGRNPIPVLIPCHRVIGANQKLTGYSGGIGRKEWLLRHEGALLI